MRRITLTLLLGMAAAPLYADETSQGQASPKEGGTQMSMGAQLRSRTGTAGLGRLDETSLGFTTTLPSRLGTFRVAITSIALDAGTPSANAELGTVPALGRLAILRQDAQGTAVNLDFAPSQDVRIQLGVTPFGYPAQEVTGALFWRRAIGSQQIKLGIERRPVTDSVLSYAGVRDPHTGQLWGGVRQSRLRLAWSTYLGGWGVYAGGAASRFEGRHVPDNQSWEWSAGSYHLPLTSPYATLVLATNVTAFGYEHNQSGFTSGQGGYFSPQVFRRAGVSATLHGRQGVISYLVLADLGWQEVRQNESPWFPLDASLGTQSFGASRSQQIGGSGRISVEYALDKHSSLGINGTINRVSIFTENTLQLYLRHWFTSSNTLYHPPRPVMGRDLFNEM